MRTMSKARTRAVIVFLLVAVMQNGGLLAQALPSTEPSYTRRQDVVYGRVAGTALTMDVFKPTGKQNGAIVVFLMSGGWISSHDSIRPQFINALLLPILNRGYVVCAVVHGSQPKFTIPEITPQINRAVQYVRANARASGLNPDEIGICGASAGGHLSLYQATAPGPANPKSLDPVERVSGEVQAVACFFPPTDFLNYGGPSVLGTKIVPNTILAAAFDFRELNAETKLWEPVSAKRPPGRFCGELSPINHITSRTPPTLIFQGDADKLVPPQQAESFIAKLKENQVECELDVKPGMGHGWLTIGQDMDLCADWFDVHLLRKTPTTMSSTTPSRAD